MVKAVLLIDSLFSGCNDEEKNKLLDLYKEAYSSTKEYKELEHLINECEFSGSVGKSLFDDGNRAIKSGLCETGNFSHNLTLMQYVINNTNKELKNTEEYVSNTRYDSNDLFVVRKQDSQNIRNFYFELINYLCYSFTVFFGSKSIKDLKIDVNQNCLDTIKAFSNEFANTINYSTNFCKPHIWKIKRESFKGINLVHYKGFVCEECELSLREIKDNCIEPKPYFYIPKEKCDIICYGIGNITNLELSNSMSILNSSILDTLKLNVFDNEEFNYNDLDISAVIRRINGLFSVEPKQFVEILNRYFMMQTVKHRNQNGECPYCGSDCLNEFAIPENFFQN